MTKAATASERRHLANVASLPCACCSQSGVNVHHIRADQGMAQRASHFLTIPLCYDCHQGQLGVHGDKTLMKIYKTSELEMLAKTIEKLLSR